MRIFLFILAIILLIAPIIFWAFVSSLACAFSSVPSGCDVTIDDYLDFEFLTYAIIPWGLSLICFYKAYKRKNELADKSSE
jgi:hypothetical protein